MLQAIALLSLVAQNPTFVHEPTSSYKTHMIRGFKVFVSKAAQDEPKTTLPALALLASQLKGVEEVVPARALKVLKTIPFFIEHNNPGNPCACYHPSKDWLKENGYNLDKEHAVEISNTTNFVAWVNLNQPYMVLHELAHGYHDLVFGFDDPYVKSCFRLASLSGTYESVDHNRGGKKRHYALNNQMEYFAEATEAYFGENDFFPYKQNQLREHDPKALEMIERCWGVSR